jgi:hypothetical protein
MYIPPFLDALKLEAQASFFKVTMLANFVAKIKPPLDCNPMWALLSINQLFVLSCQSG